MRAMLGALLLLACGSAWSQALGSFGDWGVEATDDGSAIVAGTVNDSGATFGIACNTSSGGCLWTLITADQCRGGATYHVMINAPTGTSTQELVCSADDGDRWLNFTDSAALEVAISKGGRIGFAMSLEDGQFRVSRFSANGAAQASKAARSLAEGVRDNSTRDLTL